MKPSPRTNAIIRNNLAWAAARRKVDLFVFSFLADCFFMIVSAPKLNLGRFMGDFQGLTATQINAELNRNGKFFAGRYKDTHLLDNASIIEEIGRILSVHAEREDARSDAHKPVSSWMLHETGEALVGERESREDYRNIKRANPDMPDEEARRLATTTYKVELARFAFWEDEPHRDYHRKVCEQARAHAAWSGLSLVDESSPEPESPRRRERPVKRLPPCITTSPSLRRDFHKWIEDLNFKYETASAGLRRGRCNPRFPAGMIPPHKPWAVGSPRAPSGSSGDSGRHSYGVPSAA
ncbi:MAG: hypothetical protein ACQEVA_04050 [Myxococcota bacterium]